MSLPIAILAGGLATRLRPVTEHIPKILVEVAGAPFAVHQLLLLRQHDFVDVVMCVGHLGEQVVQVLGNGHRWGMHIDYVFDGPRLLGTGGALRRALPYLGDAFLVTYGDAYLDCPYSAVETAFLASGRLGLMTIFRNANLWDRSNVLAVDGHIKRYDKQAPTPDMQHIDYGVGVLRKEAFDAYPPDEPIDLATIYADLLAQDQLAGFEVERRFYEIGSHSGLEEARQYLADKEAV